MDVVTIGETMVLFTPESEGLMRYAHTFSRKFGGAESNVAIGLTRLGHQVGWISRVGNDEFGKAMLSFIGGEGVDVSQVRVDAHAPTGLYFKELRHADNIRVQYYRKGSATSFMDKKDLDESYIKQAKYLHLSGITPALSESCYEMMKEAVKMAKKHKVTIIFDPNLRKTLWSEDRAREVLLEFVKEADIVLPGIGEGIFLFGENDVTTLGEHFLQQGPSLVVMKIGAEGAVYFTPDKSERVKGFHVPQVVDPVGAGDAFCAGFISGLLDELSVDNAVKRGNGMGAMVTMVGGDVEGLPEKEELEMFMNDTAEDNVTR